MARKDEKVIITEFRKYMEIDDYVIHLPASHPVDYAILSENPRKRPWPLCLIRGLVEVKKRGVDSQKYEALVIPTNKWHIGRNLANINQTPFWFVNYFTDEIILYCNIAELGEGDVQLAWGGRDDRDKNEQQPYVYIPREEFYSFVASVEC